MFAYVAVRRQGNRQYRYLQICHSERVAGGRPRRKVLGSLGNVDHLPQEKIDALIVSLSRFASPETQLRLAEGGARLLSAKTYGGILAIRALWEELGLPEFLEQGEHNFNVERALFRLVANRLVDPQSKLSTVEWQREAAQWPEPGHFTYHQLLRAMDALLPHKEHLERALFERVRDLFSVPLQLVWYDLTSSYFAGDGVCELAEYGYSRDHRSDRAQIALGLAVTQEGFPIAHEVFPGSTVDVTTVKQMAEALQTRFQLKEIVLVGDRGMLSCANIAVLAEMGLKYVMALRTRQHAQVPAVVAEARELGLSCPKEPEAAWTVQEVAPRDGVRHVVVYSAFRAMHDRLVRAKRLRQALDEIGGVERSVTAGRLQSEAEITARIRIILRQHHVSRLVKWRLEGGRLLYGLDLARYREQRRLDGIFVLVSNDVSLSVRAIVDAYRQLRKVEDAFRVLKTLVKLRPIRHYAERRVRSHVLLCVMAYLLSTVMEQRLERAGLKMTAEAALRHLNRVQAVEYEQSGYRIIQVTQPDRTAQSILKALRVQPIPHLLSSQRIDPATSPP